MNYEELVKALRWCDASFLHECGNCLYVKHKHCKDDCMDRMLRDAAAAIEDLQAEVDTLKRTDSKRCQECLYLGQPVGEQQLPKRGEWIWQDAPLFGNPYGSYKCKCCGCSMPHKTNYCPNCGAKMEVQDESSR